MRLFIRTDDVHRPLVWTTSRELYFTKIRWQCLWSTRAQVVIWGQHLIEPWRLFRLDFLFCSRHNAVFTLWLGNIMAWLDLNLLVGIITDGDAPTSCEKQLVLVATKNIQDITEAVEDVSYQQDRTQPVNKTDKEEEEEEEVSLRASRTELYKESWTRWEDEQLTHMNKRKTDTNTKGRWVVLSYELIRMNWLWR